MENVYWSKISSVDLMVERALEKRRVLKEKILDYK